ncbi:MAG TPA: DUF4349 domain-containing protein [Nostocaceae cyanobacterium]|nr:DUF4349 domain-containing protein [Nostocaceae cyanobacterium]
MQTLTKSRRKPVLLISFLLGGVIFTSCAAAPSSTGNSAPAQLNEVQPASEAPRGDVSTENSPQQTPRSRPQLIKKAALSVEVNSVDESIKSVAKIVEKQQGDVISLNESQPTEGYARHTANIVMRVPQNVLDPTIEELIKLGTVTNRNISAEDVGNQIVDIQARLSNLRKTEANLQKIMDRAGSVKDVLSVAQELSNVRESIERIDAQLKSLQNQVSYSTITLNLQAAVVSSSPQKNLGSQFQETWNKSTSSVSGFTVGLLKLVIWLLVYSPYLLILVVGSYGLNRWQRSKNLRLPKQAESTKAD